MKNREFIAQYKKFRGPITGTDFVLSFAFLVVILIFPLLYYFVDIFALLFLPFFVLPMFYAIQHMLMMVRINKDMSTKQFRLFFLQGLNTKVRKTFQSGKTFLWSLLVFIITSMGTSFLVYILMENINPVALIAFEEAYALLVSASQNTGNLTEFTDYINTHEALLFPYLLVNTLIPLVVSGLFATVRLYRQAFFVFYAAHMTVIDARQVEQSLRTPYAEYRREHYRYIALILGLPLSIFIIFFSVSIFIFANFVSHDIRLIMMLATMVGFAVLIPFYPQLMLSNAFMYEVFSQRFFVAIARSLQENAQIILAIPGLSNEKKRKIELYVADLEQMIEINKKDVEMNKKDDDAPESPQ